MGYFKRFPQIQYNGQSVVDILTAVLPSRLNVDKAFVFQNYEISDGETPESVAEGLYKDPQLYWVVLVVNNIVNPYTEWPIEDSVFEEFVTKKYGSVDGVHHYLNNQIGRVCDDVDDAAYRAMPASSLPFYIVPRTNWEYEKELNDVKRRIVVVNPAYVNQFVEVYGRAIEEKL